MKIDVTINYDELKKIIAERISEKVGEFIAPDSVKLYVKSKNNYRARTWEEASIVISSKSMGDPTEPVGPETELKAEVTQDV